MQYADKSPQLCEIVKNLIEIDIGLKKNSSEILE